MSFCCAFCLNLIAGVAAYARAGHGCQGLAAAAANLMPQDAANQSTDPGSQQTVLIFDGLGVRDLFVVAFLARNLDRSRQRLGAHDLGRMSSLVHVVAGNTTAGDRYSGACKGSGNEGYFHGCLQFNHCRCAAISSPRDSLEGAKWKCGCFAQDSVGDWWLCVPVERSLAPCMPKNQDVGLDLGLKDTVATSDGEKLEAGRFYRNIEQKIARAQRRGHKRQAKRLHRTAARRRKDALHKFSTRIVDRYQRIFVGDVSSTKLVKTRMAKSVLDAGWGMLKTQLQYKGQQAGRRVFIVSERYTTRACSSCGSLSGPTGLDMLDVRIWVCSGCGDTHDRDVNAAKNILSAGRCPPSISGNESSPSGAPPSQASSRCEAGTSALAAAA